MSLRKMIGLARQNTAIGNEFLWVIAAQLFTVTGGLLTIKLLSNMLSKAEFGVYSLVFSFASLLVAMLFLPLGQINMRFLVLARQGGTVREFYNDQKRLLLLISAVCSIIMIPCAYYLGHYTQNSVLTYFALAMLTLAIGYQTAQQYLLMALRLRVSASLVQMIGAVARPLGAFAAISLFGYFAISAIFGLALGFVVLSLSQFVALVRPWRTALAEEQPEPVDQALQQPTDSSYFSYGFFHALIGIVSAVLLHSDKWLLSLFGSIEQLAIYAALMQIALAPVAFASAILTRLAAPIYFASRSLPLVQQNRRFLAILGLWAVMCVAIMLGTLLFHQQIVTLLTNADFARTSYLLPWMVLGFLLERTAQVLELKGALLLKTAIYVYPRLLIIALVPLSEYVFFKMWGFDGLAIGLVMAAGFSLASIALVNHFKLRS